MRGWYKFILTTDPGLVGVTTRNPTDRYIDLMEGLDPEAFLERCRTSTVGRAMGCFLRANLSPGDRVISIGAGNGEHELPLILEGHDILLADALETPLAVASRVHPPVRTRILDITDEGFDKAHPDLLGRFDAVFVPSLFYWLDDDQARLALRNMSDLLSDGGRLLVVFRSRDSLATRIVDLVLSPMEAPLLAWMRRWRTGERHYVFRNFAGYRRRLAEFRALLETNTGLAVTELSFANAQLEFQRSALLRRLGLCRPLAALFPRHAAYQNFFVLHKTTA